MIEKIKHLQKFQLKSLILISAILFAFVRI